MITLQIPTSKDIWKALALFAYRRWVGSERPIMPVGIPGNRDPKNPCPGYQPLARRESSLGGACQTDGHYLCALCYHREIKEDEDDESSGQ